MSVIGRAASKLTTILEMIKFEHTIFALPFALTSAILAANGIPSMRLMGLILLAMVGARSAAMAFNRIVDIRYDKLNPRTAERALPKGILGFAEVWVFTIASSGLLIFAAWMLNPLAFALSPVALLVVLGYSYTKRFTSLSHLILGLALGIAPVGAWIAITGKIGFPSMLLSAAVIFWTAGFDIIYALQDIEFDKKLGLFSLPKTLGANRALLVSRLMHALTVVLLLAFGIILHLGIIYYLGIAIVSALLVYEQSLVKPDDLSKINMAFFNTNGLVSIGFFVFSMLDLIIRRI
ncbi:MAG: UbiA-like polyprenyltransferase [Armatimonadota bacterium]